MFAGTARFRLTRREQNEQGRLPEVQDVSALRSQIRRQRDVFLSVRGQSRQAYVSGIGSRIRTIRISRLRNLRLHPARTERGNRTGENRCSTAILIANSKSTGPRLTRRPLSCCVEASAQRGQSARRLAWSRTEGRTDRKSQPNPAAGQVALLSRLPSEERVRSRGLAAGVTLETP